MQILLYSNVLFRPLSCSWQFKAIDSFTFKKPPTNYLLPCLQVVVRALARKIVKIGDSASQTQGNHATTTQFFY